MHFCRFVIGMFNFQPTNANSFKQRIQLQCRAIWIFIFSILDKKPATFDRRDCISLFLVQEKPRDLKKKWIE